MIIIGNLSLNRQWQGLNEIPLISELRNFKLNIQSQVFVNIFIGEKILSGHWLLMREWV